MACSKSLQQTVIDKCEKLSRFHSKHLVICGCEFYQYRGYSCNKSYLTKKDLKKMLVPILLQKLSQIGILGTKISLDGITKRPNYIGNCAEVHSANKVYKQMQYLPQPERLNFSLAYRISTMQPINYCQNCVDTFGLSNS